MNRIAFLVALIDDPEDRLHWLGYADWLDEHDEPQEAARIRGVRPGKREWVGVMPAPSQPRQRQQVLAVLDLLTILRFRGERAISREDYLAVKRQPKEPEVRRAFREAREQLEAARRAARLRLEVQRQADERAQEHQRLVGSLCSKHLGELRNFGRRQQITSEAFRQAATPQKREEWPAIEQALREARAKREAEKEESLRRKLGDVPRYCWANLPGELKTATAWRRQRRQLMPGQTPRAWVRAKLDRTGLGWYAVYGLEQTSPISTSE
jgi:uncharacterized protein (TIGR02996 family)